MASLIVTAALKRAYLTSCTATEKGQKGTFGGINIESFPVIRSNLPERGHWTMATIVLHTPRSPSHPNTPFPLFAWLDLETMLLNFPATAVLAVAFAAAAFALPAPQDDDASGINLPDAEDGLVTTVVVDGYNITVDAPEPDSFLSSRRSVLTELPGQAFEELKALAQLAHLSFCNDKAITSKSCLICDNGPTQQLSDHIVINNADDTTHGYVAASVPLQTIFIGFRGSVNDINYLSDAAFLRKSLNLDSVDPSAPFAALARDSLVHEGFQNAYEEVREKVRTAVGVMVGRFPGFKLHAVGHSYGCAMATLSALDVAMRSRQVPAGDVSITGYGCPRIGNKAFANLLNKGVGLGKLVRVVHSFDVVPKLPPRAVGYTHFGTEVWIDLDQQKVFECRDVDETLEDAGCSNGVKVVRWNLKCHTSYFLKTVEGNMCAVGEGLGKAAPPVKYLPFEISGSLSLGDR
ncbi:hypothetical protein HDU97_002498 [Phlyctochytrium planicorne]|nr:hypothetical protein HDU97_002498 [Phlyctochytrium planicorne]